MVNQLIENLHLCGTHFTNFFRIIEDFSKISKSETELV